MKIKYNYRLFVVICLFLFQLLGCSSEFYHGDPERELKSLSGLKGINVNILSSGLTWGVGIEHTPEKDISELCNIASSMLKDAGIRVYLDYEKEWEDDPMMPYLEVRVRMYQEAKYSKDLIFFAVDANLKQKVALSGHFQAPYSAITWSTECLFVSCKEELSEKVERGVKWVIERFIDAYKEAN